MSEPFIGEIRMVGFNFAPPGWQLCNGQLLPISQNAALFSLLGTTFGGDGRQTFGLPDYRGRAPVGMGNGNNLTPVTQGEQGGNESTNITVAQMPMHTHTAMPAPFNASLSGPINIPAATTGTTQSDPSSTAVLGPSTASGRPASLYCIGSANTQLAPFTATVSGQLTPGATTIGSTGNSQPLAIRNPYLGTNFIIATEGIYPSRP